jgi:hypothetical protein
MAQSSKLVHVKEEIVDVLPESYRVAIEGLTATAAVDDSSGNLRDKSDASLLSLANETLTNFYEAKDVWLNIDDWRHEEARLLKLEGSAMEMSASGAGYYLASLVGPYLRTFVESLEYKMSPGGGGGGGIPSLLSKKVAYADGEASLVYGPVAFPPVPGNALEVWTSPGRSRDTAGEGAREGDERGGGSDSDEKEDDGCKIAVVLCAGNQNFLALIDVLDNALRLKRNVLVKHHPLRPWLLGPYGIILEPMIRRGYIRQVLDENNDATGALLSHPCVNHVHVTGAYRTARIVHDILSANFPHLTDGDVTSMITSELGCATPQILDDGVYTSDEMKHAARMIAVGKKANCGCNCLSAQVVILPKRWEQKAEFRRVLLDELERQPTSPCYYPGSIERKGDILDGCRRVGCRMTLTNAPSASIETAITDNDQVVVVECGTPGEDGYHPEPLLMEAFGPILAIVELDDTKGVIPPRAGDGDSYLSNTAVPFLNDKDNIFGSLSCSIFTPASKGNVRDRAGLRSALSALRYGAICVNQWNAFGYFSAARGGVWGGHRLEDRMQSGNGMVGDLYGIIGDGKGCGKSVVYGPPLSSRPAFDLARQPPSIVFEMMLELTCSRTTFGGIVRAMMLVARRSMYKFASYIPVVNAYLDKEK